MAPSPAAPRWRVLIADDHAILRDGLAMLIDAQKDMEVVAQACDGREAVRRASTCRPDVAVLDVSMPEMHGAEATAQIRLTSPQTKVLALTRHGDAGNLRRMVQAGAQGYVLKRSTSDALIHAIRLLANGGSYVDPSLAGALLTQRLARPSCAAIAESSPPLSERELQTLKLIAWGKSNKEVAAQLGISIKTAECYKAHALDKLGLKTRTDVLRHALAQGWMTEEEDPE